MKLIKSMALVAAFGLLAPGAATFAQDAETDLLQNPPPNGVRLHCNSVGVPHINMHARYSIRRDPVRIHFGAVFEALASDFYAEGDVLDVFLAGIRVGNVVLEARDTGVLVGRLELRDSEETDLLNTDVALRRIDVHRGTSTVVGRLGCALHR